MSLEDLKIYDYIFMISTIGSGSMLGYPMVPQDILGSSQCPPVFHYFPWDMDSLGDTVIDVIFALTVIGFFSMVSICSFKWLVGKPRTVDVGTQTIFRVDHSLKNTKMWLTKHGEKWHLYETCPHVAGKDKSFRDGLCITCNERHETEERTTRRTQIIRDY